MAGVGPTRLATVLAAMQEIAPLELAAAWDNTGLLIEPKARRSTLRRVLLTIDLTNEVAAEAVAWSAELVIAYHPAIFQPLKRLQAHDGKQRAVLAAVLAGFAVYSPHTALDAAPGGIADWLAHGVRDDAVSAGVVPLAEPFAEPCGEGNFGRTVELVKPTSITTLLARIKRHLGVRHLQVARPAKSSSTVRSLAVAAGSGSSILRGVEADVWLTGEMSHHDALAAVAAGTTVVLAGHSNTERGYLRVLRSRLRAACGKDLEVRIAKSDRDPFAFA